GRMKAAREWGDLRENSEYHDAKNEQAHLETRIARLRERIATAVIVERSGSAAGGVVGLGSSVVVRDPDGVERTWRIVSSHEAAPAEGRLSAESPVALALLGRGPGARRGRAALGPAAQGRPAAHARRRARSVRRSGGWPERARARRRAPAARSHASLARPRRWRCERGPRSALAHDCTAACPRA